jgi:outer membrane biosynthesis protein TonB
MNAPIFISYSSKDRDIAETICKGLEARGLNCWISCRDVRPGDNFQEAIVRALRSAQVMLLVFTSNANNSDEIKKEVVLAGRHRVTVVPVRVEDVVPNDAFSYEFATRQWFDLFKNWEHEIEQLAIQLRHLVQAEKPQEGTAVFAAALPPRVAVARSSNMPLMLGSATAAVLIAIGGAVFYLRHGAPPAPAAPTAPPSQAAAQIPPPAPSPPPPQVASAPPPAPASTPAAAPIATPLPAPQAATPAPPPEPPAPPQLSPDDAAWQTATAAATRASFGDYLKGFPAGLHAQAAELRIANLIMNAPAAAKNFDGAWQTEWTCPNLGEHPGYTFRFVGQIKDGAYHGLKGVKNEPSSLDLNGKIDTDGTAGFFGEIIVGSSVVALGAPRGTQSDFHAIAHFTASSGDGKRIEGRPCTLSFVKQ